MPLVLTPPPPPPGPPLQILEAARFFLFIQICDAPSEDSCSGIWITQANTDNSLISMSATRPVLDTPGEYEIDYTPMLAVLGGEQTAKYFMIEIRYGSSDAIAVPIRGTTDVEAINGELLRQVHTHQSGDTAFPALPCVSRCLCVPSAFKWVMWSAAPVCRLVKNNLLTPTRVFALVQDNIGVPDIGKSVLTHVGGMRFPVDYTFSRCGARTEFILQVRAAEPSEAPSRCLRHTHTHTHIHTSFLGPTGWPPRDAPCGRRMGLPGSPVSGSHEALS